MDFEKFIETVKTLCHNQDPAIREEKENELLAQINAAPALELFSEDALLLKGIPGLSVTPSGMVFSKCSYKILDAILNKIDADVIRQFALYTRIEFYFSHPFKGDAGNQLGNGNKIVDSTERDDINARLVALSFAIINCNGNKSFKSYLPQIHSSHKTTHAASPLEKHHSDSVSPWGWRRYLLIIAGVLLTGFMLALIFSPLGPLFFGALPLIGNALASAAAWVGPAAPGGQIFLGVLFSIAAGFAVAFIDYVLGSIVWTVGMFLKHLLLPFAEFGALMLHKPWSTLMQYPSLTWKEPWSMQKIGYGFITFFSLIAVVILSPFAVCIALSESGDLLRAWTQRFVMVIRNLFPSAKSDDFPTLTPLKIKGDDLLNIFKNFQDRAHDRREVLCSKQFFMRNNQFDATPKSDAVSMPH